MTFDVHVYFNFGAACEYFGTSNNAETFYFFIANVNRWLKTMKISFQVSVAWLPFPRELQCLYCRFCPE